jgi:acyl phosphate:glycerol-3-phosphate acyltransferase
MDFWLHEMRIEAPAPRRKRSEFRLRRPTPFAYSQAVEFLAYALSGLLGYLLGSIPTGFLVGKARGVDIRSSGSGNIGATNAFRVLGKTAGTLVLLVDALKGFLACFLAVNVVAPALDLAPSPVAREFLGIAAGIAAILGHNYTVWLRFKGGKGIATSAGVLIAWAPGALLVCLVLWLAVLGLSRYVSVASITAAFCLPLAVAFLHGSHVMILITAFIGALAIYKHKSNLQRLRQGTEHRLGSKPKADPPQPTT